VRICYSGEYGLPDLRQYDYSLAQCQKFSLARVLASRENPGRGRGNDLTFAASTRHYIYPLQPDDKEMEWTT